jgi:hypothetical protein
MPEAPKASHLSTVVQSELFDTDIEKLSAQADERWALFQSPRRPCQYTCVQGPARTPPCRGLWLFGAPAGYEQSCTVFALARGLSSKEAVLQRFAIAVVTFITTGRWVDAGVRENSWPTARRGERVGCFW